MIYNTVCNTLSPPSPSLEILTVPPPPSGVCGSIPRGWMRRAKTTCLSTCCWSAVRRPRCAPSSSSPSSTPRERRPKPWVRSRKSHILDAAFLNSRFYLFLPVFCSGCVQKARGHIALSRGKTGALRSSSGETFS